MMWRGRSSGRSASRRGRASMDTSPSSWGWWRWSASGRWSSIWSWRRWRSARATTPAARAPQTSPGAAPGSLRRDFYLSLLYVVINVVFAGLYLLEPGSVSSAAPGSFTDAFFFSVQTMSTIGYGAMSPASPWGMSS